jgi:hypothetical protein
MTDLQFVGWFMLTGICLFTVGEIRYRAARYQRKWLLWFLILPGAVLSCEAWFILKGVALDVRHNWRIYFFVLWIGLTYYLWERGNEYKRQLQQERFVDKETGEEEEEEWED